MDDKKTYPASTVTISTEEYRDLIAESAAARAAADRASTDIWSERAKTDKLQKELDSAIASYYALVDQLKRLEPPKSKGSQLLAKIKEALHA